MIGPTEIIIILVAAVILIFGSKKIGEFGRSLGRFNSEYKKGKMEAEKELKAIQEETENGNKS